MALVGRHERMSAARAYELGMVSEVVDPPERLRGGRPGAGREGGGQLAGGHGRHQEGAVGGAGDGADRRLPGRRRRPRVDVGPPRPGGGARGLRRAPRAAVAAPDAVGRRRDGRGRDGRRGSPTCCSGPRATTPTWWSTPGTRRGRAAGSRTGPSTSPAPWPTPGCGPGAGWASCCPTGPTWWPPCSACGGRGGVRPAQPPADRRRGAPRAGLGGAGGAGGDGDDQPGAWPACPACRWSCRRRAEVCRSSRRGPPPARRRRPPRRGRRGPRAVHVRDHGPAQARAPHPRRRAGADGRGRPQAAPGGSGAGAARRGAGAPMPNLVPVSLSLWAGSTTCSSPWGSGRPSWSWTGSTPGPSPTW